MKLIEKILGILIIDIVLFWLLIRYYYLPNLYENPDFLDFKKLIIFVVILNLIIFGILNFIKSKFKIAFLINIFLAPLILLLVQKKANENYLQKNYAGGNFNYQNKNYSIFIDKAKESFLITRTDEKTNETNIQSGKIKVLDNKIILENGKEKYYVENDSIKGIDGKKFKLK